MFHKDQYFPFRDFDKTSRFLEIRILHMELHQNFETFISQNFFFLPGRLGKPIKLIKVFFGLLLLDYFE